MYELQRSFLATFRPPLPLLLFLSFFVSYFWLLPVFLSTPLSLSVSTQLSTELLCSSRKVFGIIYPEPVQFRNTNLQRLRGSDWAEYSLVSCTRISLRGFFLFFVPRERKKVIHCIHGDDDYKDASDVSLDKWNYSSNELQFFLRIEATLLLICART